MASLLKGKNIILGVTGGIAAFKAATLVRLFVKSGAEVKVVMTPAAKEFITPLTLATLSRNAVISDFFTANTGEWHSHVDLGLWADCMVIAPATASTIGKMVAGISDNMLVTTYLSARSKVFVAPAMDFDMMRHPSTLNNISRLRSYGNVIIEPEMGELASGLTGKGRMAEPETIVETVERWFVSRDLLNGKKILVTAGPTYEKLDPVRFIGNFSSGKMGYAIAEAAANCGADVTLVSGPVGITSAHSGVKVVKVESAAEMLGVCEKVFPTMDVAILAAAVSDYRPESVASGKIKREGIDEITLKLVKNPDIAATLGSRKHKGQYVVGFALETDNEQVNAVRKLKAKNLDMIVLNSLKDKGAGFGTDTNKVTLITDVSDLRELPLLSKTDVAREIIDAIAQAIR